MTGQNRTKQDIPVQAIDKVLTTRGDLFLLEDYHFTKIPREEAMVKKSAILLAFLLGFAMILGFPGFSSENWARIGNFAIVPAPFGQTQLKNPLARSERFRQNRRFFAPSQDVYWICSYGTIQDDLLYTIQQTKDGGYLATGVSYGVDGSSSDATLIKLNSEGSIEWQRAFGRESYDASLQCSVAETSDGGYILATDSIDPDSSPDAQDYAILVLKLSSEGSILWQKIYGKTDSREFAHGEIQQTYDGGYILAGTSLPFDTNISDILVMKLDSAGNIQWDKIFRSVSPQWGDSVKQTSDGGYIVGGSSHGFPWILSDGTYPLFIKLDSYGNIEWQKLYEGYGRYANHRADVIETKDNDLVVADYVQYSSYISYGGYIEYFGDIWVLKLDSAGNIRWQNVYGGSESFEQSHSLCETNDGGYMIGGYIDPYASNRYNGWILKLDSSGNIAWQKAYGEKIASTLFLGLSQKENGDLLAAGYILRPQGQSDTLALNVNEDGEIGEGSEWVTETDAFATPTFIVPVDTDLIPVSAGLIASSSNASSPDCSLSKEVLCWNLHQPPINVSLKVETNRSLYVKELYRILSWEPNPQNDEFNIAQYKIYRKYPGEYYEHLKTVPANTFEYNMGLILKTGEVYEYAITSLDSEGRESPKSASVSIS